MNLPPQTCRPQRGVITLPAEELSQTQPNEQGAVCGIAQDWSIHFLCPTLQASTLSLTPVGQGSGISDLQSWKLETFLFPGRGEIGDLTYLTGTRLLWDNMEFGLVSVRILSFPHHTGEPCGMSYRVDANHSVTNSSCFAWHTLALKIVITIWQNSHNIKLAILTSTIKWFLLCSKCYEAINIMLQNIFITPNRDPILVTSCFLFL